MNFIKQYKNCLDPFTCREIIAKFELDKYLHGLGETSNGLVPEHKSSTEITVNYKLFHKSDWNDIITKIFLSLQSGLSEYKKQFSVDNEIGINSIARWKMEDEFNIQRFTPGEGFKAWHCESPNLKSSNRVLVWMFYLNDVDDGGTDFYFQDFTCKAEEGKLVIWPPDWTHFHRSQVSHTKTKYIITGWFTLY